MNRKEIKWLRFKLLDEQAVLEQQRCGRCYGCNGNHCDCPAAVRIREIGKELGQLSRKRRKPPEQLNLQAYQLLKSWDWDNKQIRKHYGISQQDFTFWMRSNGLLRNKKEGPKVVAKANEKLTVELYMDLKAKGLSDAKIGEQFDMKQSQISYWRKKQGVDSVRDAKQKRIEAIVGVAKEKENAPVVVQERQTASMDDVAAEISRLKRESAHFAKLYDEEQEKTHELTKQLERSKETYMELARAYQDHMDAQKDGTAAEWRRKYEHEHLNYLEANAVIMEQKETIRTMNDAWDDDTEATKAEARQLREQNAYLKAELQNAKKIQGIHDEFKVKAVQQIEKKNKLIYAFMDYHREEA